MGMKAGLVHPQPSRCEFLVESSQEFKSPSTVRVLLPCQDPSQHDTAGKPG